MDIRMFVHQHIIPSIVLLGREQFLRVSYHIEAWIYPLRTEDEVTIV